MCIRDSANVYLALDHDLDVLPVINKIDLPSARPEEVAQEIEDVIGIEAMDAPRISAKTGLNIEEVLEQIVTKIPAPAGDPKAPLKALIFDALYDSYKGVIVFCRIKEGTVKVGTKIKMMATGAEDLVTEVGYFGAGQFIPCDELSAGMVGYIAASIKNVRDTRVGDTVTELDRPCAEPLPDIKRSIRWCTADYIRQTLPSIRICGMRLKNCRSMMHRYSMNRRHPLPWDLDSAADFWDYCILRLFRSV